MNRKPLPYTDDQLDVFWKKEEWDDLYPKDGFLSDFITSVRGVETPTKFALWSGIFLISSSLKRETFLQWHPSKLYPNFFVIIVGPPRILGKSTVVDYGETQILSKFHEHYTNMHLQKAKRVNIVRKATPEALTLALEAEKEAWYDPKEKIRYQIDRGSQVSLVISELSTFLGKQKYNMGLIDRLTKLYDCKDIDDEYTISRGKTEFRKGYVTLYGATTKDGLENSIPSEAFGSGFMSRLIIVYSDTPTRSHPIPLPVRKKDGTPIPWVKELQMRLAWLAEKSIGEFSMSSKAKEAYIAWYGGFKKSLVKQKDDKSMSARTRMDNHLVKLMLIMRAQRYTTAIDDPESLILTLEDFNDAQKILTATMDNPNYKVEDAQGSEWKKWYNRIQYLVSKDGSIQQKNLLMAMSGNYNCRAVTVREIISQLKQEGRLRIETLEGKEKQLPSVKGDERYIWTIKEVNLNGLSTSHLKDPSLYHEEDLLGVPDPK